MIHYHGGPITPVEVALAVWKGRHGLISFAYPAQLPTLMEYAESFVLDNGAFSSWKAGKKTDWPGYYSWVREAKKHPRFDWALIPDTIDGTEEENDDLLAQWPHGRYSGVPVWHLHESFERLDFLVRAYPRIALGSSGQYSKPGAAVWTARMVDVFDRLTDEDGWPKVKIHGLRMLSSKIVPFYPFSSGDSATVALNVGLDVHAKGVYKNVPKHIRGIALAESIDSVQAASTWKRTQHTTNDDIHNLLV